MIKNSFDWSHVFMTEQKLLELDGQDGEVDNKISIKIFNDFAEANGLQKIEGQGDTEQIDIDIIKNQIKNQMIQSFCKKYPEIAEQMKAYLKEGTKLKKIQLDFEELQQEAIKKLQEELNKSSEPQFGL